MLPGDGGDLFGYSRALHIPGSLLVLQELGKDRGVVEDDAIGDQAAAFRPEFWLVLGLETEFAAAGVGDGAPQLVIVFAPIQETVAELPGLPSPCTMK